MSSETVPVTLTVQHEVSPLKRTAFGVVLREMAATAAGRAGYVAAHITEPRTDEDTTWRVSIGFEDELSLAAWRASPEWARLNKQAEALSLGAPQVQRVNGLEQWFQLPLRSVATPPPRWKTAVISAIGIYPLLLIMPDVLAPLTQGLPQWLATIASVVVMSPLITWVVMPAVTRVFRGWLYQIVNPEGGLPNRS
ncbi:MAG TPA: antibiotic biosynthesis monooxygenase [Gemmatimonas sp.]|nr:antibiotic biosynthesis monooxygenase [Gemmatimonas sp.]